MCEVPCKREKVGHFCAWEKFYAHMASRCTNLLTSARNEITGEIESEMTRGYCATLARFTRGLLKNTRAFEDFYDDATRGYVGQELEQKLRLPRIVLQICRRTQSFAPRHLKPPTPVSIRPPRFDGWAYALSHAKGSS